MYNYDHIYKAFIAGDVTPFYEQLYPGLLLYASRLLGEDLAYLAEDCVQDAVMTSYTMRKSLKTSPAWYSYILKCVYHSSITLVRKHHSQSNYLDSPELDTATPEIDVAMLEQETLDRLHAAIESLPLKYRNILRMSYREGLKNAEIAQRLGVAEITVKKYKAHILALLREKMGDISSCIIALLLNSYTELSA
ncbi:MAG: sigma-70 family RNA polymerase sigma factor [Duncaniella sp.]|uniref:RNA polymerase sigma factor n=1 Tax=Duncaniella sp. TaxID=2518496 RepID=UPI0023D04143|nr:sigma-70 family RNA polymerase sigma factor [Duncaniella sp.]MDE5988661.1 sigma-70 family RNA polymerase sigma factor [Duncaniella sp.]